MSKHLADHREAPTGARVQNFTRIASNRAETVWNLARRQPRSRAEDSTRLAEYIRIEKGVEA